MISYSIDVSVYAYPFDGNNCNATELKNYYDTIVKLEKLIFHNDLHAKQYYLFEKDISIISGNDKLNLLKQNIPELNKILKSKYPWRDMEYVMILFKKIISRITINKKKYIIFDEWFKIKNVEFNNGIPPLPEVDNKINKYLLENTKKNIAKIAYLNKYVYQNNNIHNIIIGNNISSQPIILTNWEFSVTMAQAPNNTYRIKNTPSLSLPVCIDTQNVNISNLDALVKNNYKYKPGEWEKALIESKKDFDKHLEFGNEIESGLKQYTNKIINERNILLSNKIKEKNSEKLNKIQSYIDEIDRWMKVGPDNLYENLKALDDFLNKADLTVFKKDKNECYSCDCGCRHTKICGSNIRFFGVDCCDDWGVGQIDPYSLKKKDRTRENSKGKGSKNEYWKHLSPITRKCDKNYLSFLTLRIHFEFLNNGKIEIGWIGRHLYQSCPKKGDISKCERPECPLHPASELTNYLTQWK